MESHYKLINRSAKLSYYLLLLIVVPVLFNLENLLGLWLKEVPLYTKEFCYFVLLAYLVDAIGAPLSVSVFANGNIKYFQIINAFLSVFGLVAGFLFLRSGALPYIVSIIIFFVHLGYLIEDLFFARKYCDVSVRKFVKRVFLPILLVSALAIFIPILLSFVEIEKWTVLLIVLVDLVWVAVVIYLVGLEKEERSYILNMFISKLKRKKLI